MKLWSFFFTKASKWDANKVTHLTRMRHKITQMTSNRHRNATQRCKVIVNNQNEHKEIQKRGRKKTQQRDVKQQK